jgi:hypothetical protein
MKRHRFTFLGIFILFINSCSIRTDPSNQTSSFQTLDEHLLNLESQITGFGGMYFDDSGVLNVYLKRDGLSVQALESQKISLRDALDEEFGNDLFSDNLSTQAQDINIRAGQYSISQLYRWREQALKLFDVDGVETIDLDEEANRVSIGISSQVSEMTVQESLSKAGIPLEAVIIRQVAPIKNRISLLVLNVRPVAGGLSINWDNDNNPATSSFSCTLGFNAKRGNRNGFVTNSHCSGRQGGNQSTKFYQHLISFPETLIGTEIADPRYYTHSNCPGQHRCRLSDSAFAAYEPGVDFNLGRIYKTTDRRTDNTDGSRVIAEIDGVLQTLKIIGKTSDPIVGQRFDKIGRSSGWSSGRATKTCVDVNVENSNILLRCQTLVNNMYNEAGDSGSPIFRYNGTDNIRLAGILWGGNDSGLVVFSPIENIEEELGALITF